MGFFRSLFYALKKNKCRATHSAAIVVSSERKTNQSNDYFEIPDSESMKVRSDKDVERIQGLPDVKIKHVIDGDTVIVSYNSSKLKIRLDSIDCPEKAQEWGDTATHGLIKLVGGKFVKLEIHGSDIHGRTLGTLFLYLQGKDYWQNVNERMVTLGHAWVMHRFYNHLPKDRQNKLNRLERWARSKKVGLWQKPNSIPPWKWREVMNVGSRI